MHPLDLMNAVPADGDIPREIVAAMRGCLCRGNSHDPDAYGCPMGEPISVTVEAYRKLRALNAELVEALATIADDEATEGPCSVASFAGDVLRRLGLRD